MEEIMDKELQEAALSALERIADWLYAQGQIHPIEGRHGKLLQMKNGEYLRVIFGREFAATKDEYYIGIRTSKSNADDTELKVYSHNDMYCIRNTHNFKPIDRETAISMMRGATYTNTLLLIDKWETIKQIILKEFEMDKETLNKINSFNPNC